MAALVVHVVAVMGRALLIACVAVTILLILALLLMPGQGLVVGRRGAVIAGIGTDLLRCYVAAWAEGSPAEAARVPSTSTQAMSAVRMGMSLPLMQA